MVQTLDALALAALPEDVLIPKLAKRFRDRPGYRTGGWAELGSTELSRWVRTSFGPLLSIDGELEERRLIQALRTEIRTQTQIAQGRRKDSCPPSIASRRARVVHTVLGPPSRHLTQKLQKNRANNYTDSKITKGLVLALITGNELTGNASLLVFRPPSARVQVYWIGAQDRGGACRNLDEALEWLTTPAVREKVARGLRVELEWHKTRFRVYHPDGRTSTLPWRKRT